jgi:hypothetical protein
VRCDVGRLTLRSGGCPIIARVGRDDLGHADPMSREIPEPVRAAAGLAATVVDEVRKLPETIPGLPVRAIGLAMQAALKLQQEYAGLVARGDELFTGIRGESEPGLATFDDEEDTAPAPASTPPGFRDSAFDLAEPPPLDAVGDTEQAEQALEEIAIEELVDAGPAIDATGDADAIENALLESEGDAATAADGGTGSATLVDVADGERGLGTVEAVVTEEAVVAPEPAETAPEPAPATDTDAGTATDEGGTPVAAAAPAPAGEPVDGYDGFSIAQLRGRLRGYAPSTVEELLAYEQANRAREPYLRMLRNRLERLTADEVAASPLAPRGT